jgi:hypothetical protein
VANDFRHADRILFLLRCPEKPIPGPLLRNNFTQVYLYLTFFTSSTENGACKGSTPEYGQRHSPTVTPLCLHHFNRPNHLLASHHIHLSGVPVDLLPGNMITPPEIAVCPDAHAIEPLKPGPLMAQPTYLLLALVGAGCPHKHPSGVPVVDSTFPDSSSQFRNHDPPLLKPPRLSYLPLWNLNHMSYSFNHQSNPVSGTGLALFPFHTLL